MANSSPIKPPRGIKYGKESSGCGLLVTVIKTLDASETNEDRQREKNKIDKELKKTDKNLNALIEKNDGKLTKVMQIFGQVSTQITISREKVQTVRSNLNECKKLLRCKREELQKLWMDAMQQKFVAEMLEQINDLCKVPSQVQLYITDKQYLHATKTLIQSLELLNGPLSTVDGLCDLRQDLEGRIKQLNDKLIKELNVHLYQLSTTDTLTNFQRQGSTRNSNYASPFQRTKMRRSVERAEANAKMRKILFEMSQTGFQLETAELIKNTELLDADSTFFIIIECFALLKKCPELLATLKSSIQPELSEIVTKTTHHIVSVRQNLSPNEFTALPHPLLELLELAFTQFKQIADVHNSLLKQFLGATQRHTNIDAKQYDISDYWQEAQAVFQTLLTDYLDIQNSSTVEQQPSTSFIEQTNNINAYFRKKTGTKKLQFKFVKASINNDTASANKEHRRNISDVSNDVLVADAEAQSKRKKQLVCDPNPSLIRTIYLTLMKYINEMEAYMKGKSDRRISLHTFLKTYIKDTFLAKGHNRNLQLTIESLTKNHDAWRAIITPEEMKTIGLTRPLLQSTVLFENRITDTKHLIQDLPDFSEELLIMVCGLLKTYRETCQNAYRGIVQQETEDKRTRSVAWLNDVDITRFLKSLPNWTDLKTSNHRSKLRNRMASEEESPTQVQQRNIREAEMLTSNLGEGGIAQQEILSDISVLKELAILQESMEWFSSRITEFANDLRKPPSGISSDTNMPVIIKDGTVTVLTNIALEFEDLANTCLLVLHLEVRVQCFHYLKTTERTYKTTNHMKGDSLEPDVKVLKLTKVLSEMEEAMVATLHPRKTKYIFEGLAHLAAIILINASNYMDSIDEASVQRMCRNAQTLKQTLGSITSSREVALDHVMNFYEMLYKNPEDIVTLIKERGPQYTELQYLNALQLSCKAKGMNDANTLASYQQKLSDILGTKAPVFT